MLGRCVVVAQAGERVEDPSSRPRRATRPVIHSRVREDTPGWGGARLER